MTDLVLTRRAPALFSLPQKLQHVPVTARDLWQIGAFVIYISNRIKRIHTSDVSEQKLLEDGFGSRQNV